MRRMRRYEGNEHHTVVELTKLGVFLAFFAILSRFRGSKGLPGPPSRKGMPRPHTSRMGS